MEARSQEQSRVHGVMKMISIINFNKPTGDDHLSSKGVSFNSYNKVAVSTQAYSNKVCQCMLAGSKVSQLLIDITECSTFFLHK